jgi:beta-phosphoglucomutase-like phosphatase (HAD superfamily)
MIKTIIFDFDGVVADTMNDNFTSWQWALQQHGYNSILRSDYFLLEGKDRFEIARAITGSNNYQTLSKIVESKEFYYSGNFECKLFPQMMDILLCLKSKNLKIGLVTGASRTRITKALVGNKINDFFDCIVTADDTNEHKPSPVPYLTAISMLNTIPNETIIIENAILGIESAISSGAICFGITTTMPAHQLEKANLIFNNHLEILIYFQNQFFQE